MRMIKLMTALFVTLMTSFAYATPATDLSSLLNSIHTMKANFTQTIYDNNGKAIQKASGKMALERPGKFRWETKQPIPQLIIANDSKLWIYDPDLEQVTIRKLHLATGDAPALLLSHTDSNIDKDYVVTHDNKAKVGVEWFNLQPKGNDSNYSQIRLGFFNNQIQQMNLVDHLGHSTQIAFQKTEINSNLSSNLFRFKSQANVDVIDETKRQ